MVGRVYFQMVEVMSAVLRIRIWLSHRLLDLGLIEAARRLVPEVERYRFE
jgi:hypothetical protein